ILFVDHAVLIDHERHDAGVAIVRGISDERKAACELAVHNIIFSSALGSPSLFRKQAIVVAVIGRLLALLHRVTFAGGRDEQWTDGAGRLVVAGLPVQTVLLAFIADELQRIVLAFVAIVRFVGIVVLGVDQ